MLNGTSLCMFPASGPDPNKNFGGYFRDYHEEHPRRLQSRLLDLNLTGSISQLIPDTNLLRGDMYDGKVPYLIFKIHIQLFGDIHQFVVEHVDVQNCDLKILGLKVFSFCKLIRRMLKMETERLARKFNALTGPRILKHIENMLHYRLGDYVYVPLLVADETAALLTTLIEKTEQVSKFKSHLINDLSVVARDLADKSEQLPKLASTLEHGTNIVASIATSLLETGLGLNLSPSYTGN